MDSPGAGRPPREEGRLQSPSDWSEPLGDAGGAWDGARKAPRYLMDLEIRYRPAATSQWSEGRTIDISRCGVLFAGAGPPLPVTTPVEFLIAMPAVGTLPGARVHCSGHVVRVLPQSPIMASTIEAYSFEKPAERP